MVFGQMNEPPGARLRVGLTGVTMAEYFRDEQGKDGCSSSTTSSASRRRAPKCSALLGRMPSAVGYQPTLATEMGRCRSASRPRRRARSRRCRRSTCPPTTCRPGAGDGVFAPRRDDGARALDCRLGIYPAVDPLASTSRILDPAIVGEDTTPWRAPCSGFCSATRTSRTSIAILGMDELSETTR